MKNRIKRLTALILAMAMCLSLLSVNVWATEAEPQEDASIAAQSSEEAALEESTTPEDEATSAEESTPDEKESALEAESEEPAEAEDLSSGEESNTPPNENKMESNEDSEKDPTLSVMGSMTRDEAVAWLNQQDGKWYDLDGKYGCQCSDFVSQYMRMISGTQYGVYMAYSYHNQVSGDGRWSVIRNYREFVPEPGDIFESTSTSTGHVGVVISSDADYAVVAEANTRAGYGDNGTTVWVHRIAWKSSGPYGATYYIRFNDFVPPVPPDPTPEIGSEMTSGYDRTLPDGDYLIVNAGATDKTSFYYLDIEGTAQPASNKTNVSLCGPMSGTSEIPSYEIWTLNYNDGFYMITQKDSSAALDVWMDGLKAGENVQAWETNYSSTQKWAISTNGRNGYRLQAKSSGFSLDVAGGGTTNGTNVQQYPGNDTDAQSWLFIPYKPSQPIENGRYILLSAVDESLELDVSGDTGDIPENTNVQIWKDNCPSKYNSFDFKKLDNGYYKVTHAASGKALDVSNGQSNYGTNVCVYTENGTVAQQWSVTKSGNYYYLRARCNGYALDLKGAGTENGTNVEVYPFHGGANQSWKFVRAEYNVSYSSNGGSNAPTAQTKYYKENLTLSTSQPTRSKYDFKGWNTKADGTGKAYAPGESYVPDEDVTLYAQWEKSVCKTHTWDNGIVTTPATCVSQGTKTYTCTVCNETKVEEIPIDKKNHTGGEEIRNRKEATCGEPGYSGDTYCNRCGKKLSSGKTIRATGNHSWNSGVVTKQPTYSNKGTRTYTCTVCGETKKESIPKLDQTSSNEPTTDPDPDPTPTPAQKTKLPATKLSKVTVKKNVATVTWKKNTTGKGYQLQYSTDKKFKKSVKTVKISKNKTVKATVKNLKTGTWYFRIRTVSGKKTSGWSKVKSVKVK